MEKIKRLFLYAGANPEEFAQGQQEMHDYNYGRLSVFLALAIVFLGIASCSALISDVLSPNLGAYLIAFGVFCCISANAVRSVCKSAFSSLYSRCTRSASTSAP